VSSARRVVPAIREVKVFNRRAARLARHRHSDAGCLHLGRYGFANAGSTKNVLAGVINSTAVVVFLVSGEVPWLVASIACIGALLGSIVGARLVQRVNERWLRVAIVVIDVLLTICLFLRSASYLGRPMSVRHVRRTFRLNVCRNSGITLSCPQ
jgi:hypothetical protein